MKNKRKGTKKQDARTQLLAKREGRVKDAWWSVRRTKELHAKRPSPMRFWGWGTRGYKNVMNTQ